ncbi:MAG: hypothetical protein P1U89_22690 [Verrucomicrobiales bacterium]|nr:hypothetical protein [Verrucomicrobiales bacterium]
MKEEFLSILGLAVICAILIGCSSTTTSPLPLPLPQKTSPITTSRTEQSLDRETGTWKTKGTLMVKPLHREPRDIEYPEVKVKPKQR